MDSKSRSRIKKIASFLFRFCPLSIMEGSAVTYLNQILNLTLSLTDFFGIVTTFYAVTFLLCRSGTSKVVSY